MRPVPGDVHINRPLTNMSLAIFPTLTGFVANTVFPRIPSQTQSDAYFKFDETYFNRDSMKRRAPGARAEVVKYAVSNDSFFCNTWSLAHLIPDELRANADSPLDLDMQANELLLRMALIRQEKLWVDSFFKPGVWTGYDKVGVSGTPSVASSEVLQWDDDGSDPIGDVQNAQIAILAATGLRPMTLVVGVEVDTVLKRHAQIINRIQYGGSPGAPAVVTNAALAQVLGVNQYLVMEAIEETAQEGATSDTEFIGGKKALLVYTPTAPGIMKPAAGYTFTWTGMTGATANGYRIKKFRQEPESSDAIQIDLCVDQKLVGVKLGAFFDTIVS